VACTQITLVSLVMLMLVYFEVYATMNIVVTKLCFCVN